MGLGVLVTVWVTRYLGPAQFGGLSYAIAFAGILTSLASLGLDGIVVRELAKDPSRKEEILGTSFLLKLGAGSLSVFIAFVFVGRIRTDDPLSTIMTAVITLSLVFNSLDVIDFWFQSQVKSRFTVYARNAAFLLSAVLKIVMILLQAPLTAFAFALTVEAMLGALGLAVAYRSSRSRIRDWRFSFVLAKRLLGESWPLIIAGFATFTYMRIGQIMLGSMLGNESLGIYSAAAKISEIWYFIPTAIYTSVLPIMVEHRKNNEQLFYRRFRQITSLMASGSILIALVMTLLSNQLIAFIYGFRFLASGPVLAIHIWAGVFVFIGIAGSIWTMVEGHQKISLFATVLGGITNILLNLVLIPYAGAVGAAVSTVASYCVAGYIAFFFLPKSRKMALILSRALFAPWLALAKDRT